MARLRSVLDEEIGRLREEYRAPIVLCYFEGKSYERAAQELGWPKSSLAQRLTRARKLLHDRLTRRGISLSAGALAVALCEKAIGAPVTALLILDTVKAATSVLFGKAAPAACVSRQALTSAEEAMKSMPGITGKFGVLLLSVGLALAGGLTALGALAERDMPAQERQTRNLPAKGDAPGEGKKDARADRFGDPLPEGAVGRLGTVRFRHGYAVFGLAFSHATFGVAFSPDGKVLASAGSLGGGAVCGTSPRGERCNGSASRTRPTRWPLPPTASDWSRWPTRSGYSTPPPGKTCAGCNRTSG